MPTKKDIECSPTFPGNARVKILGKTSGDKLIPK